MSQQPEPAGPPASERADHRLAAGPARTLVFSGAGFGLLIYLLGFFGEVSVTSSFGGPLLVGGGLLAATAALPRAGRVLAPAAVLTVSGTLLLVQLAVGIGAPAVVVSALLLALLETGAVVGALLLDTGLVVAGERRARAGPVFGQRYPAHPAGPGGPGYGPPPGFAGPGYPGYGVSGPAPGGAGPLGGPGPAAALPAIEAPPGRPGPGDDPEFAGPAADRPGDGAGPSRAGPGRHPQWGRAGSAWSAADPERRPPGGAEPAWPVGGRSAPEPGGPGAVDPGAVGSGPPAGPESVGSGSRGAGSAGPGPVGSGPAASAEPTTTFPVVDRPAAEHPGAGSDPSRFRRASPEQPDADERTRVFPADER